MSRGSRMSLWRRTLAPAAAVLMVPAGAPAAGAHTGTEAVADWISSCARPPRTIDPSAPLDGLAHLRRSVGGTRIVGLGESSTHGTKEQTALKFRVLRFLVEEMGFRSIAWEDDWTLGVQVNDYVLTGSGDVDAPVGQMSVAWRSVDVVDVLRWPRGWNASHRDRRGAR